MNECNSEYVNMYNDSFLDDSDKLYDDPLDFDLDFLLDPQDEPISLSCNQNEMVFPNISVSEKKNNKKRKFNPDTAVIAAVTEETLKTLELDPNSVDGKKKKRQIRNRMSAQYHRDRKNAYIHSLEQTIVEKTEEIRKLHDEVNTLIMENNLLRSSKGDSEWHQIPQRYSTVQSNYPSSISTAHTDSDESDSYSVQSGGQMDIFNHVSKSILPSISQLAAMQSSQSSGEHSGVSSVLPTHTNDTRSGITLVSGQNAMLSSPLSSSHLTRSLTLISMMCVISIMMLSSTRSSSSGLGAGLNVVSVKQQQQQQHDPYALVTLMDSYVDSISDTNQNLLHATHRQLMHLGNGGFNSEPHHREQVYHHQSVVTIKQEPKGNDTLVSNDNTSLSIGTVKGLGLMQQLFSLMTTSDATANKSISSAVTEQRIVRVPEHKNTNLRHSVVYVPTNSSEFISSGNNSSTHPQSSNATEGTLTEPLKLLANPFADLSQTHHVKSLLVGDDSNQDAVSRHSFKNNVNGLYHVPDYFASHTQSMSSVIVMDGRAVLDPAIVRMSKRVPIATTASMSSATAATANSAAVKDLAAVTRIQSHLQVPLVSSSRSLTTLSSTRDSDQQASARENEPAVAAQQQEQYMSKLLAESNLVTIQLPLSIIKMRRGISDDKVGGEIFDDSDTTGSLEALLSALNTQYNMDTADHANLRSTSTSSFKSVRNANAPTAGPYYDNTTSRTAAGESTEHSPSSPSSAAVAMIEFNCMVLGAKLVMVSSSVTQK